MTELETYKAVLQEVWDEDSSINVCSGIYKPFLGDGSRYHRCCVSADDEAGFGDNYEEAFKDWRAQREKRRQKSLKELRKIEALSEKKQSHD